jgi:DNA replication protein DnaC
MDNSLLKQVLHEYDEKRTVAILEADNRKKELLKVNPRLLEIEKELSTVSIQTSKAILLANPKEKASLLADLKKKNNSLIKEKNAFIKNLSKENNYLNPHFDCKLCKDTGYIQKDGNLVMCSCLKQRIFDIAYNKSNMGNLERENFSNFNIRVFSDKPDKEKYKSEISPRENMQIIKEKVQTFIDNFDDTEEKNLIFTGNTGVGKTFLTNCIANEVLKIGKTVLYQTAPVMFDEINDAKFGRENSRFDLYENILNVDLLIIDDLGTEKITDTKITELFTIINTRLLNQNHKITKTIISTNLTIDEIFKTYTTRIGSRLAGNYRFLRFFGEDLRFKKAKKEA